MIMPVEKQISLKEDENIDWYCSGESEGKFGLFPRLSNLIPLVLDDIIFHFQM